MLLILLLIGTHQTPGSPMSAVAAGFVVTISALFFIASAASGLFGGLRRVVIMHGTGGI